MSTTPINIAFPETGDLRLRIAVGACKLNLKPGDTNAWVTGSYDDPSDSLPVKIEQDGGNVKITQNVQTSTFWNIMPNNPPRFDLTLGKAKSFVLVFEVGASESVVDLGGLPITRLEIKQGAGKFAFNFSSPNPQPMSLLDIDGGALDMEFKNLANANFAEMTLDGGAAGYRLDFGGTLQRDAHARITTGVADVQITVPNNTPTKISVETVLGSVDIGDGLTKREGAFCSAAAMQGKSPVLAIAANVSVGSLRLRLS